MHTMSVRRHLRDVDVSLLTHHVDFNLEQSLAHDDIDGLGLNEVAMYTGNDLTSPVHQSCAPRSSKVGLLHTLRMDSTSDLTLTVPTAADGSKGVKWLKVSGATTVTWYSPGLIDLRTPMACWSVEVNVGQNIAMTKCIE